METPVAYAPHSFGYRRTERIGSTVGALHAGVGVCSLDSGGRLDPHLHSFEELVFVLAGAPRLSIAGIDVDMAPDDAVGIAVGETHAWSNPGEEEARWIELRTPPARGFGEPIDTIFAERGGEGSAAVALDPGDPRRASFGRWTPPGTVSPVPPAAGMAAPLQSMPGISARMVLDQRHGAAGARTFAIEFQPGARLGSHDHPFEETFFVLEGEIAFTADGVEHTVRQGDIAFAGVGCLHSFENRADSSCRWLESQSPLPPTKGDTRVQAVWDAFGSRFNRPA
jgi:quercetin dioxygenase-like cupin family protein